MKIEYFKKNKNIFLILGVMVLLGGGYIALNNNYELAYTINGDKSERNSFPNKDSGLISKNITCKKGVSASWNNEKWSLLLNDSNNQKEINCRIDFSLPSLPITEYITKLYGYSKDLISLGYTTNNENKVAYYGQNPNNYVSFNGELWRVIGVVYDVADENGVI